jgi:hypothetical protein
LIVLSGGVAKLDSLQVAYAENFSYPSLSAASAAFSAIDVTTTSNSAVSKAVMTTLDAVDSMSQDAQTLDTFVNLHIPKMEDGNNFGVTVREYYLCSENPFLEFHCVLREELWPIGIALLAMFEWKKKFLKNIFVLESVLYE